MCSSGWIKNVADDRRWEVPGVTPTHAGQDFFVDEAGEFWRAIDFVDASHTLRPFKTATTPVGRLRIGPLSQPAQRSGPRPAA
ncbi:MAG: hypothetical protein R2911_28560 [Caldilineaceae bacterium]